MFQLRLICTGRLKEAYFRDACREYEKRLAALCSFQLVELAEQRLPDRPAPAQIRQALQKEAEAVRQKIPRGAVTCVFTPEGQALSSEQLAAFLARARTAGRGGACFVIGSSYGLDETLKQQADARLSVSKMTFPHHLFRVMALEQLYRAEALQANIPYHK